MSHPVDTHVGKRFRYLRKERSLSHTAVAKALSLTFQQIQKYERGTNRLSASKLYQAAALFGLPIEAFFEGLDETNADNSHKNVVANFATSPDLVRLATLYLKTPPKLQKQVLDLLETFAELE